MKKFLLNSDFISKKYIKAFTLIELVMIMVLISILAVSAIPSIKSYYSIKLDGGMRKLAADMKYVQQLALSKHAAYGIEFDVAGNSYRVFLVSDDSTIKDPNLQTDMVMDYDENSEFVGISLDSADFGGTTEVIFSSLGVPKDANDVDLVSAGTVTMSLRGTSRSVTVTPETGRVSM